MSSLKLAAFLVFALATSAFAADSAPTSGQAAQSSTAAATKPAADPKEKLICTRETLVGSTIPKRVCRTAAQIDHDRASAERTRENLRGVERDQGEAGPAAKGTP